MHKWLLLLPALILPWACADTAARPATPAPAITPIVVPTPTIAPTVKPTIARTETITIFFPKVTENDVAFVPVKRVVAESPSLPATAINELLRGPTAEEQAQGLHNPIPNGTRLLRLEIRQGIARADFDSRMEDHMGGSVRVMTIRQMIVRTLKQSPDVKDVIISVEGRTEDILQP